MAWNGRISIQQNEAAALANNFLSSVVIATFLRFRYESIGFEIELHWAA